jgi:acetyl esterase/lipase
MATHADVFPTPGFSVRMESDLVFAQSPRPDGELESLRLDLYLPEEDQAALRPVILWLHGGGFRPGNDKRQSYIVRLATEFAARGYVGIASDYRVCDEPALDWTAAVRDAVADARLALDWVRANAVTYRIDARRIALVGGSAGGMIVHNLCHDSEAPVDAARDGICAAVSLWGPPRPEARLFTRVNPLGPPTLFIHGTADALVPHHLSPELLAELNAAGVEAELLTFEGAPHTPVMHMDEIIAAMTKFLYGRCR